MRIATLTELQTNALELVRASSHEDIIMTDQRQPVAVLKKAHGAELIGKPFPKRDIRKMPKSDIDSTEYISQDRDGR